MNFIFKFLRKHWFHSLIYSLRETVLANTITLYEDVSFHIEKIYHTNLSTDIHPTFIAKSKPIIKTYDNVKMYHYEHLGLYWISDLVIDGILPNGKTTFKYKTDSYTPSYIDMNGFTAFFNLDNRIDNYNSHPAMHISRFYCSWKDNKTHVFEEISLGSYKEYWKKGYLHGYVFDSIDFTKVDKNLIERLNITESVNINNGQIIDNDKDKLLFFAEKL